MRVRDLDALQEAAEACGLELRRDQKTYAWWGRYEGDSHAFGDHDPKEFGTCAHAIGRPGTTPQNGHGTEWEIGVVQAKDGDGYDLLLDTFGSSGRRLEALAGPNLSKLRREYSTALSKKRAEAKLSRHGWRKAQRFDLPGNHIRLILKKG
jgi:hypothetical protein